MAVQAFRNVMVNGTLFYDSLIMRTPTKMVAVLSRPSELVKLEDDRRMSRGDRSKERLEQYIDVRREVLVEEVLEHDNHLSNRP